MVKKRIQINVIKLTLIIVACMSVVFLGAVVGAQALAHTTVNTPDIIELLTPTEKDWLNKHKTIRIAGPKAFPPFHYFEADGALKGMAADYINLVFSKLKIAPEIQNNLAWPEVLKKAEERNIDLISCSAKTTTRESYLSFTDPYLSFPLVIISKVNAPFIGGLDDLHGRKVVFVKGAAAYDWIMRDNINVIPHFVRTPLEALQSVSMGHAAAHIDNLAAASHLMQKHGLSDLKIAAPTSYGNYNLYIAVRKDWPELVSIINKVFPTITPQQHSNIRNKWLAVRYDHGIRRADVARWILGISGILAVVVITILWWNRRLNREIHQRKRAERELKLEKEFVASLIDNAPTFFVAVDNQGKVIMMNQFMLGKLGYTADEVIGRNYLSIFVPERERAVLETVFKRLIKECRHTINENHILSKDGREFLIEWHGMPGFDLNRNARYLYGIGIDITERRRSEAEKKKLESQLQQTQKMEAIGTLAGGIAHDFNNILGAIIGYAQLAGIHIPENSPSFKHIEQILAASERAKSLVGQILAFSRQTRNKKNPADIGIIVKEVLTLLRASLPANIEIHQHVPTDLGTVMADPTQIHQIMMNLCTNAFHAMDKKGGHLEVSLVPVELKAEEVSTDPDIKPGRFLNLSIKDSGHGMDTATIARIFEPYFTTKEAGEGTGLGLSTVHGIVKDHSGMIKVHSEPGAGTSFQIYFPCIESHPVTEVKTTEPLPTGTEQILFVDDEKVLVDIGQQMLEKLGYLVDCRTSPYEALEAFKAKSNAYDMVITDMTMPKMTGDDLAKEILKIRHDIPIIICTGFSNMMSPEKASETGIKGFLMKPITMTDLSSNIRNVLDNR